MISDKVVRSFCSPNDLKGVVMLPLSIGCSFCLHLTLTSITRPIPSPGFESYVAFIVLFNYAEGPRDPHGFVWEIPYAYKRGDQERRRTLWSLSTTHLSTTTTTPFHEMERDVSSRSDGEEIHLKYSSQTSKVQITD